MRRFLLALMTISKVLASYGQVYVAADATGANDGTSWADAYTDIQSALVGGGSEVWVKAGTYYPTAGNDRTISIVLNKDLYGGFDGTESAIGERDPKSNPTIISGNIGDPNLATDNTRLIIEGSGGILDGFTIQDGYNEGGVGDAVASYDFVGGTNEIRNCIFKDSYSINVAGIAHTTSGNLKILDCEFFDLDGKAIMSAGSISKNVEIVNNLIHNVVNGSPLFLDNGTYLLANNTITYNSTSSLIQFIETADIFNNIFFNSGTSPLQTIVGTFDIRNNIIEGTTDPNNFDIDPGFTDVVERDFRLRSCSGARDIGSNSLLPSGFTEDLDGNARTFGTNVDPGAYEIQVNPLQLVSFQAVDAECNLEASGRIDITTTGGSGILEYSVDGGMNYSSTGNTNLSAGTYDVYVRDEDGCGIQVSASVMISEPAATLTPVVVGSPLLGGTTYGTPFTGIQILPNVADANATHFLIAAPLSTSGRLFKSDGITQLSEGDFITVAEGADGLVWEPTVTGSGSMFIQSAAADRSACVAGSPAFGQVGVSKAALTATMPDQTISYGENPDLAVDYTGFVNGEDESDLDAIITISTSVGNTTTPGSYLISASGTLDTNYDITYVDGTITVEKATLTTSGADASMTYGDASLPALRISYSGFANGEDASVLDTPPSTVTTTAQANSTVGTYAIQVSQDGSDDNYDFVYVDGELVVNKASLTSLSDDQSMVYGEELPSFTGALTGLVNDDEITATYSSTGDGSSAGTFDITAALSDPNDRLSNYELTNISGTLTVSKVALSVVASDQTITYGESPVLTGDLMGLVNDDDITASYSSTGNGTTAGTFDITATLNDPDGRLDNYEVTNTGGTLTISKAPLTVTAPDQSVTFGDEIPTLSVSYSGFVNDDDDQVIDMAPSSITVDANQGSDAGTYVITVSQDASDNNYDFIYENGTLTIEQAEAVITLSDLNQDEDGTAKEPTVTTDPSDLSFTLEFEGLSEAPSAAGSYPFTVTIDDTNYKGVAADTLIITEREGEVLSLDISDAQVEIYPNPTANVVTVMSKDASEIHVVNLQGALVHRQGLNQESVIDVSSYERGIYIVHLVDEGTLVAIRRLIVR